jgi:hypothetical protein
MTMIEFAPLFLLIALYAWLRVERARNDARREPAAE